ncbi:MAG: hypothetical protein SWX82_14555, partial [Cyanobacteriota bacterium]|nr:hypothetical protein [Cyanobacteriota bacterium]
MAVINWTGNGDGSSWFDQANWENNTIPGSTDDAIINVESNPTIQVDGSVNVNSLNSSENLRVIGGALNITNGLTLASGVSLRADGATASVLVNGASNIDGASLFAANGGSISLPGLTNYESGDERDTFIQADGTGSKINLSSLTSLPGGGFIYHRNINSLNGGEVDLSGVTSIPSGATEIRANGSGSLVNLSNLNEFIDNANDASLIESTDGGTVNVGNLTDLNAVNIVFDSTNNLNTSTSQFVNF